MAQISVNHLTFGYEGSFDNIFEEVSFSIDSNWKLGFVGRNGKGKTTFLNLLQGKYEYSGSISTNMVFDYFPYFLGEEKRRLPASDFVEDLKPGVEMWRIFCELDKLKVDGGLLYRPFCTLSFGEQTKILLAVLFSGENEFLLIDEPTNHLDMEAREVVKHYLSSKQGFVLVSHDRDLLDACVDHVLVLNRKTIEVQAGNFSSWWENKQRKDAFAQAENEKHLREIGKLEEASRRVRRWADKSESTKIGFDPIREHDRFTGTRAYIGAKTKKMQSQVKNIENRISAQIEEKEGLLQDIETIRDLKLYPLQHHKQTLVSGYGWGLGYLDGEKFLFEDLTFQICQGDRVILRGKNGCGKSSLIKAILQQSGGGEKTLQEIGMSSRGELTVAGGMVISYINQDTSWLKGDIRSFCRKRNLEESLFCAILRQLDMERVQFAKNMEEYSEGQKKKVLIAASLMTQAHLYIWDEPLNYIDVYSRMQIEQLILQFHPTMLVVEHDVKFGERIGTKFLELAPCKR